MRRIIVSLLALTLAAGGALAPLAQAQGETRCFAETGYCISDPILTYWERNGGLPIFGYPIAPLQLEVIEGWRGPAQWFERDRLEDHSADGLGVLAGRLGVEVLALHQRPWQPRPLGAVPAGCLGFPETGYTVCGALRQYWERNGGLERFGYPITELIAERLYGKEYQVQYFERRRMELHPEHQPPSDILLGLLGRELHSGRVTPPPAPARSPTPLPPTAVPPTATPAVRQQIFIDFPTDDVAVRSPFTLLGHTALMPGGDRLHYRVSDDHGEQLAEGSFAVTRRANGRGEFDTPISFSPPVGDSILLELRDIDPASGEVLAVATHAFAYNGPQRAGTIVIESPLPNDFVSPEVRVAGHTTYAPSENDLFVRVLDVHNAEIRLEWMEARSVAGELPRFEKVLNLADQGNRRLTIEVFDRDNDGNVLARAAVQVTVSCTCP